MSVFSQPCAACGQPLVPGTGACRHCARDAAPLARAAVRGTVLRDTNAGPGLVLVGAEKKTFTLERHWQGTMAPQVQMQVEVTLDEHGDIAALAPARTGADELDKYREMAKKAIDGGTPVLLAQAGRIGKPVLAAVLVIAVSWTWLPAASVTIMAGMTQGATLFDLLRLANSGASLDSFGRAGGSSGPYGLLCVLAMCAPLLPAYLRHKYAPLGYCAPLAFLALVFLAVYLKMRAMADATRDGMRALGGGRMDEMADAMMQQIAHAFSVGFGTWLSLAAALYLGWRGAAALLKTR